MSKLMSKVTILLLTVIFILALVIRFLYFPENINFAYDQARDSFASLEVVHGHLRIIGPPTTISDKIFHGVLFYYLLAPIFQLSNGNIEIAAGFLRVLNAAGVFLVFVVASNIFNKKVGFLASFLYAISYEQSQYSLFFGHPSLGVFTILIFYLGLSFLIFRNNPKGFIVALLGLGSTIQAETVNGFLILVFLILVFIYRKNFLYLNFKIIFLGVVTFLIANINYLISEIKYNFRGIKALFDLAGHFSGGSHPGFVYPLALIRFIHDNLLANNSLIILTGVILIFSSLIFMRDKNLRPRIIFLLIWFFGGLMPFFFATSFSYYYSPAASVGLLILVAFLMDKILNRVQDDNMVGKVFAGVLIAIFSWSNLSLILTENKNGPNPDIVIQRGMILGSQKKVLDYIYEKSGGEKFAVNGLTIPLNVKTTWDYLFNWYGKSQYGYLPVWGGTIADGFPGKLKVIAARDRLPKKQFTIIEPTTGIEKGLIDDFFREENYFTKVIEEKDFNGIKVQLRVPI